MKIPPQLEGPGFPLQAPSMLHLIQLKTGGCQRTSLILGALLYLTLTKKALRRTKFVIEDDAWRVQKLPAKEVPIKVGCGAESNGMASKPLLIPAVPNNIEAIYNCS